MNDLPNVDGYRFIGIDKSLNRFECIIKLNGDSSPYFMMLVSWDILPMI